MIFIKNILYLLKNMIIGILWLWSVWYVAHFIVKYWYFDEFEIFAKYMIWSVLVIILCAFIYIIITEDITESD